MGPPTADPLYKEEHSASTLCAGREMRCWERIWNLCTYNVANLDGKHLFINWTRCGHHEFTSLIKSSTLFHTDQNWNAEHPSSSEDRLLSTFGAASYFVRSRQFMTTQEMVKYSGKVWPEGIHRLMIFFWQRKRVITPGRPIIMTNSMVTTG